MAALRNSQQATSLHVLPRPADVPLLPAIAGAEVKRVGELTVGDVVLYQHPKAWTPKLRTLIARKLGTPESAVKDAPMEADGSQLIHVMRTEGHIYRTPRGTTIAGGGDPADVVTVVSRPVEPSAGWWYTDTQESAIGVQRYGATGVSGAW